MCNGCHENQVNAIHFYAAHTITTHISVISSNESLIKPGTRLLFFYWLGSYENRGQYARVFVGAALNFYWNQHPILT
jgi:hypothetical protein